MPEPIVFYDIPRKLDAGADPSLLAWSPNTWKTRYALNIKKIPYKTVWLGFEEVEPEMKKLGMPPTGTQMGGTVPFYTVPTITDPATKRTITDSQEIVKYLDEQYPDTPALLPPKTRALQAAFVESSTSTLMSLIFPILCYPIFEQCSTPSAANYFRETREMWFGGKKLEDIAPQGEAKEKTIKGLVEYLDKVSGWIDASGEGSLFLTGDVPSNADVNIASILVWTRLVAGSESELWKAILGASGGKWAKFMAEFKKYEAVL